MVIIELFWIIASNTHIKSRIHKEQTFGSTCVYASNFVCVDLFLIRFDFLVFLVEFHYTTYINTQKLRVWPKDTKYGPWIREEDHYKRGPFN